MALAKEKMVTLQSPIRAGLMKMAARQFTVLLVERENAVRQSRDRAVRRIEHGVAIDMSFRPKVDFDAVWQLGNCANRRNKLRRGNWGIALTGGINCGTAIGRSCRPEDRLRHSNQVIALTRRTITARRSGFRAGRKIDRGAAIKRSLWLKEQLRRGDQVIAPVERKEAAQSRESARHSRESRRPK
jgi:hypothetical protein